MVLVYEFLSKGNLQEALSAAPVPRWQPGPQLCMNFIGYPTTMGFQQRV
ncbi:unnamed protein product [Victoria cruziana]